MNSAETRVRVLHAAAGAPALDVVIGAAHSGVRPELRRHHRICQRSCPTAYAVQVTEAGGGAVLAETTLEALIGSDYTIAVTGSASDVSVQIVPDENGMPTKGHGPGQPAGGASSPPIRAGWMWA